MTVRAVTVDFWGTLLFDPPSSDNRYKSRRVKDLQDILAGAGVSTAPGALERAYDASGVFLSRVWARHRDVPVSEHVRAILADLDRTLPDRVPADVLAALVEAYARPALLVPPAVDDGARKALTLLREAGYVIVLISNTMRTPGVTLRKLLEHYGLLGCFHHTVFSDEAGVRKPDPAIFLEALAAVGSQAPAAIHVGDDAVLDVEGARAAGMRVIQVTTSSPGSGRGAARPDAVIRTLADLPAAVARLDS